MLGGSSEAKIKSGVSNDRSKRIAIGGAVVDSLTTPELMDRLDGFIASGKHHYVLFCEAHLCVKATHDSSISRILHDASLVLADGVAMTLGARCLGERVAERQPGPVVMLEFCRYGVSRGYRHFFYGAAEGVVDDLSLSLREMMPGLKVAGTYSPPFRKLTSHEEEDVKRMIEDSGTHVLWVGLGAPKQELWIAEHVGKIDVPLMMGVGAAFDFHSGHRKWAPPLVRRMGVEWVYRMFTGGRRVFIRNARNEFLFTTIIAKQSIRKRIGDILYPNRED